MSKNASTYLYIKWYEAARKFGCCTAENFQLQGKSGCNCTCIQASSSMEKAVFCAGCCSHTCTTSFCSAAVGTTTGQPEPDGRMLQGERRVNGIRSEGLGFFWGVLGVSLLLPRSTPHPEQFHAKSGGSLGASLCYVAEAGLAGGLADRGHQALLPKMWQVWSDSCKLKAS